MSAPLTYFFSPGNLIFKEIEVLSSVWILLNAFPFG